LQHYTVPYFATALPNVTLPLLYAALPLPNCALLSLCITMSTVPLPHITALGFATALLDYAIALRHLTLPLPYHAEQFAATAEHHIAPPLPNISSLDSAAV
jgi:hypothetical protein